GAARGQLGLEGLVLRVDVVVDADAGGRLEVGDGVLGDVVRPVEDVEHLLLRAGRRAGVARLGLAATAGDKDQGAGKRGEAQGHGSSPGGGTSGHVRSVPWRVSTRIYRMGREVYIGWFRP